MQTRAFLRLCYLANKYNRLYLILAAIGIWSVRLTWVSGGINVFITQDATCADTEKVKNTVYLPYCGYKSECYLGKYCIRYLISPSYGCSKHKPQLLTFVMSRMSNFHNRQHIRDTWANKALFRERDLRVIFILSKMGNYTEYEDDLYAEAEMHDDLVLLDFVEHYDNITLKSISGLHWAARFCHQAEFVLKTDDDVIINMFVFMSRLHQMKQQNMTSGIIAGDLRPPQDVMRVGRYKVSIEEYPQNVYPIYLYGSFYFMSADVVQKLDTVALNETGDVFLRIEDALMSGVYPAKANVTPIHMTGAQFYYPAYKEKINITSSNYRHKYVWHANGFNDTLKNYIWNHLFFYSQTSIPYDVPNPDPYNYLV